MAIRAKVEGWKPLSVFRTAISSLRPRSERAAPPNGGRRSLLTSAVSLLLLVRLPVDGHYFWDLFPAFVLGGAGMGLAFVPVTILALAGVSRADAGVASGLINTSRQIGGAIGIAGASAIAAAATSRYDGAPNGSVVSLDHGYQVALVALTGLLLIGAALTGFLIRPETVVAPPDAELIEEAA